MVLQQVKCLVLAHLFLCLAFQCIDGTFICTALPTQYYIINYVTGGVQDLFPYDSNHVRPIITRITRVRATAVFMNTLRRKGLLTLTRTLRV